MVLRVQPVANPAVGKDWKYAVPGQYLMDVVAVQATLTTPFGTTVVVDSATPAHNAVITGDTGDFAWAQAGPFAGVATDYSVAGQQLFPTGSGQLFTNNSALFGTNPWSVEALVYLNPAPDATNSTIAQRQLGGNLEASVSVLNNNADPATIRGVFAGSFFTLAAAMLPRGAWHHVAFVADGANWLSYLDGVLKSTVAGHQPPSGTSPFIWIGSGFATFHGRIAAVATYPVALSPAQMATHIAALSTHDNYRAAVLADAPSGLWMLDDVGSMGSRLANLEITDGTTTLADYPGGTITGVASTFGWTWASKAPGIAQTPNAQTNLVPIPDLRLPPGYTIGTLTPDIKTTDQWSNVNIWWDDGALGPVGPQGFSVSYWDRMLVPDYGGR